MNNKEIGFVIMQIGNSDLDKVYKNQISPSIESCGLSSKRIDKHNEGKFLKGEIIDYIERAKIIIADLTNERPNCYLEIGYAMGLDKFRNLILTAREDHFHESPNYKKGGSKIHFDLSGYDILFWDPNKLEDFEDELVRRINRRLLIIEQNKTILPQKIWNQNWLTDRREHVKTEIEKIGLKGSIEIMSSPLQPLLDISQKKIVENVDKSAIHTFGWPIGLILTGSVYKTIPKTDGVISEIVITEGNKSYDYSYYKKDGQIFIVNSYFEDSIAPDSLIIITRVYRITETLMYLARYYEKSNLPLDARFEITIKHQGFKGRYLTYKNDNFLRIQKYAQENEVSITQVTSINDIEKNLNDLVCKFLNPLFVLFDFFEPDINTINSYIDKFVSDSKNANS